MNGRNLVTHALLTALLVGGCGPSIRDLTREGRWRDAYVRVELDRKPDELRAFSEALVEARDLRIHVRSLGAEQLAEALTGPVSLGEVEVVVIAYTWQPIEGLDEDDNHVAPRVRVRRDGRRSSLAASLPRALRVEPTGVRHADGDLRVLVGRAIDSAGRFLTRNAPAGPMDPGAEAAGREAVGPPRDAVVDPMQVLQRLLTDATQCEMDAGVSRCTVWRVYDPSSFIDDPGPDALTLEWVDMGGAEASWEVPLGAGGFEAGIDVPGPPVASSP